MEVMKRGTTIAILGCEKQPAFMAKLLASTANRVLLFDKEAATSVTVAERIKKDNPAADIESSTCAQDNCWEADIIVVSAEAAEHFEIPNVIGEVSNNKTVIVFCGVDNDNASVNVKPAEQLQLLLPNSKVVQLFSPQFEADGASGDKIFLSGQNQQALAEATQLANTIGLNATIVENLSAIAA
jgi:predicted dinucleotide-binding enzyme